ncbi:PadR family transcriptional regulator [Geminicoccus roseus]|uniref:PadR family transcriptional regulator n=1 Tax=Geminicoccus roseus TaxID=404900 RepID=UPI000553E129|nr:PadR family transcriptional regulator [Geminicoccus roseus]
MSKSQSVRSLPREVPDYTSRTYWSGTIKMSLSKFFILRVLHDQPMHGYDIARAVERVTNGCCSPTEGTIYPVLREFEEGGYVTSETMVVSGRQRKTYTLTEKGRIAFAVGVEAWLEITQALVDTERLLVSTGSRSCCR